MANFYEDLPHFEEQRARLDQDWCAVGVSIQAGSNLVRDEAWEHLATEFPEGRKNDSGERRAATNLTCLLGVKVHDREASGVDKAVDIKITYPDRRVGVVEVTSTTDSEYAQQAARARRLEKAINDAYKGCKLWVLDLMRGWSIPKRVPEYAEELAATLHILEKDTSTMPVAEHADWIMINESIRASIRPADAVGVEFCGWDGRIPDRGGSRYLDRLNQFLRTEPLILANKLPKLLNEAQELGAVEQHLYILVDSMGGNASLLPISPALFTQGKLEAPEQLTDLWLDGGTGGIFHWKRNEEWTFHPIADAPMPPEKATTT